MQDTLRVEVFQSQENLLSKVFGDVFVETTIFTQATSYGTARNILQETWQILEVNSRGIKPTYMLRKFGVSSNPRYVTIFG